MEVSMSGYYAWRRRLTEPPKLRRKTLAQLVRDCYFENRRRYGVRRIKAALNKQGIKIGKYKVRILMKEEGLKAIGPKSFKPKTTDARGTLASPNLLKDIPLEECAATKIIIGDITYIPLQNGAWCYLAVWQDTRNTPNHRLESERRDDSGFSHFSIEKSDKQRTGQSRSNHSLGSGKSIRFGWFSAVVENQLFSSKYERERQLLR